MARQVITKLLDDLDGSEADETVSFSLDGVAYEIDLNRTNASKIRDLFSTYIEAGTRVGRAGQTAPITRHRPSAASIAGNRELNHAIREWALSTGYELAERGRIPTHIQDAYSTKTPNPHRMRKDGRPGHPPAQQEPPETLKPERPAAKSTPAAAKKASPRAVSFSGGGRKTA